MNTERINSFGKPDKKRMQINQQIFRDLSEIVELYPQYSFSQHLAAITRQKDKTGNGKELFHWNDEELLKRIQQHKQELIGDEQMLLGEDGDGFDEFVG